MTPTQICKQVQEALEAAVLHHDTAIKQALSEGYTRSGVAKMDSRADSLRQALALLPSLIETVRGMETRASAMESTLIDAGQILNDIRARDGTYGSWEEAYFSQTVDQISELLGGDILRALWKRMSAKSPAGSEA